MTDGFSEVDWDGDVDLEERIADCPPEIQIKGMFFNQIRDIARQRGIERYPSYSAFRDYPTREWLGMLGEVAREALPRTPIRRAIETLAHPTYPIFRESLIGRVIFTLTDFDGTLRLAPKAYRRAGSTRYTLAHQEEGHAIIELRRAWEPLPWHLGVYLGAFDTFDLRGTVRARIHAIDSLDLELRWTRA